MKKKELIEKICERTCFSKKETETLINSMTSVIIESLKNGEPVSLYGFGTFEVKKRASRICSNPQNPNEKIEVAARNVPIFKPSKKIKEEINR